jgi:hypothetical protein
VAPEENMKRVLVALTGAVALGVVASASSVSADNLQIRAGAFFPRVQDNLCAAGDVTCRELIFNDDASLYNTSRSGWNGATAGIEYSHTLDRNLELGIHLDGYSRSIGTSYRNYTYPDGSEIRQRLKVSSVPLGLTLRLVGGRRHATVRPYVGLGGDVVFWKYQEEGSFITDFTSLNVLDDSFRSSGAVPALDLSAGLRLAISRDAGFSIEGRYIAAAKADMKDDFSNNRIDVSGGSVTGGFYINF